MAKISPASWGGSSLLSSKRDPRSQCMRESVCIHMLYVGCMRSWEASCALLSWSSTFRRVLKKGCFFFFPLYFYSSITNTLQLRSDLFHAYLSCATAISHTISYMSSSSRQLSRSCISNPTWFRVWAHGESYVRPLSGLCNMPWPPGSGYQALLTYGFIALDVLP